MRTVKTLKPGKDGTKDLLTRFGSSLLYVRYRYDEVRREHLKTVELIVQRRSSEGADERLGCRSRGTRNPRETEPVSSGGAEGFATRRVALRIGWRERDLQRRVKSAGGRWDPDRQVWFLRRDAVERLDLRPRVVGTGTRR